jgi:hypothetical protein
VAASKLNVRRSVERLLIPALAARGFEPVPGDAKDLLNPYGRFRRRAADGAFEIVEIHFNEYRTSHFQLHFAVTRQDHDWVVHVIPRFRLVRRRWTTYGWFGVRKKAREGISEAEYDAAVEEAIRLVPEIQRVFAEGRPGWHVVGNPQSAGDFLAHLGLLLVVFVTPFLFLAWLLGWLYRNL